MTDRSGRANFDTADAGIELTRREFLSASGSVTAALGSAHAVSADASKSALGSPGEGDTASLQALFLNPPPAARPMTRWWWFGGAMTPEEITRELALMRDAGLGGVELQPVYPVAIDDPAHGIRNTPYFTERWFDLIRHTALETSRLRLQFDFTLGSGWPYGGPFIPLELSARRLRVLRRDVEGPSRLSFLFLSGELMEGEQVLSMVAAPLSPSGMLDLAQSRVVARGEMAVFGGWSAPAGKWAVMLFIDSPTRMQVKRPTLGMEGYVLDHFNRKSLTVFLEAAGDRTLTELRSAGARPIHSVFCDSLEVYGADWTGALIPEFKRRRGYDLEPFLPALWENAGPLTPHLRYDYHLTLSELILENFFHPLLEWSEAHGVTARVQAHGAMGDVMRAYSLAHIPEGEDNPGHDRYVVNLQHRRLASSAGHVYGKRLISAETYTALRTPLFLVTLEIMKAVTDGMFLDGINQIVNHGYPASPPAAGLPGWTFYAATAINHNSTWWRHYRYLTSYIHKVAALLRQGTAVNPVTVYLPLADIYAKYGCGSLNVDEALQQHLGLGLFTALRRAGYDFDVLNDHALTEIAKVDGAHLRAGTAEYSAVIVPACNLMPPESLEKLVEFVRSGGEVIFIAHSPGMAPGVADQDARTKRLQTILRELLDHPTGKVSIAATSDNAIERLGVHLAPDFQIVASGADTEGERQSARENVGFVHRRLQEKDFYFVSNISAAVRDLRVRFQCGHKNPEVWYPETGYMHKTPSFSHEKIADRDATEIDLRLEPYESCFVVFRPADEGPAITHTNWTGLLNIKVPQIKNAAHDVRVTGRVSRNGEYFLTRSDGHTHRFTVRGVPDAVPLSGPWKLRLGSAVALELQELRSWSDLREGKDYSGWAIYETTFDWSESDDHIGWSLDLGEVRETAEAELNGIPLGAAWKGARRLPCKGALKVGQNALRIQIANLWIQKVVNSPPWDRRAVAATYGARGGEPEVAVPPTLPPSGLLGPVRLVAYKRWTVNL